MPSLIERLVSGNGQHRLDEANLMIRGPEVVDDITFGTYQSSLLFSTISAYAEFGQDGSAEMDIIDSSATQEPLSFNTGRSISIDVVSEHSAAYTPVRLDAEYSPDSFGRLNLELALKKDSDMMEIQQEGLLGHVTKSGGSVNKLSAILSLTVEAKGDAGGLEPVDPEPEEPEPVEPSEPEVIVQGGGINEVTLQVNPNSYYTLGIGLADGVSLHGVTGLDSSMKWDGLKQTLSGWVLGSNPKEVTVSLGTESAKLRVSASPVSRHVV